MDAKKYNGGQYLEGKKEPEASIHSRTFSQVTENKHSTLCCKFKYDNKEGRNETKELLRPSERGKILGHTGSSQDEKGHPPPNKLQAKTGAKLVASLQIFCLH